jgi:hypothetical protein
MDRQLDSKAKIVLVFNKIDVLLDTKKVNQFEISGITERLDGSCGKVRMMDNF